MMLENNLGKGNARIINQKQAKEHPPTTIFCYDQSSPQSRNFVNQKKMVELLSLQGRELKSCTALEKPTKTLNRRRSQPRFGLEKKQGFLLLKSCELDLEINAIEIDAVISSYGSNSGAASDFAAYKIARDQDPAYVDRPQFKIGFLRAERYDARKAALRLLRFLSYKLDTFGRDELTRCICPEDVGKVQVSSKRDTKETETKVSISENSSNDSIMNESIATLHFNDTGSIGEPEFCGSVDPEDFFGGTEAADNVGAVGDGYECISEWEAFSTESSEGLVLDCDVRPEDVLLGRGRKHPGNDRFRTLVANYYDKYEASRKHQQTKLANEVVQIIVSNGGRFLEKPKKGSRTDDKLLWVEIESRKARLKVAHTFRSIRKQKKKASTTTSLQQ